MTGWSESGLYAGVLYKNLAAPLVTTAPDWTNTLNKFFLTSNSDTPDFTQVAASAIYAATNEVSGTGWAAGGLTTVGLGFDCPGGQRLRQQDSVLDGGQRERGDHHPGLGLRRLLLR